MDYEKALKDSFQLFLRALWNHLGLPPPTPKQLEIADYLQTGPKRRIIMAFRGIGKSWITAAYVLWLFYKDGELKILVVSGTSKKADAFVFFVKQIINEWPLLSDMQPRANQRDKVNLFDIGTCERPAQSASLSSTSILGTITGGRADKIIFDDIETPENSLSADMREKLHAAQKEFEALLKPEPQSEIVGLGTPQTEESVYWEIQGYDYRIWPARVPAANKLEASYKGYLAPSIMRQALLGGLTGDPTDTRFPEQELTEKRLGYGAAGFALQFMLDTALSDDEKYPLKTHQFSVVSELVPDKGLTPLHWSNDKANMLEIPSLGFGGDRWFAPLKNLQGYNMVPWERSIMAIDPSGRGKDETSWVILNELLGKFYLCHAEAASGSGYDEDLIKRMAHLAKLWNINEVWYEANFGDGMYGQIMRPIFTKIHPCIIDEVKNYGMSKEQRIIDTLEPVLTTHKLITHQSVIKADLKAAEKQKEKSLFYQLTHISREKKSLKYDDRLDSLAIAVGVYIEDMNIDLALAQDRHHEDMLQQCADSFMQPIVMDGQLNGGIVLGNGRQDWSEITLS